MGLILTTTFALCLWVVLWAIDVKAIDAFMIALVIFLVALTNRIVQPYLPGNRGT